jgi:hypothetical protein
MRGCELEARTVHRCEPLDDVYYDKALVRRLKLCIIVEHMLDPRKTAQSSHWAVHLQTLPEANMDPSSHRGRTY